MEQKPKPINYPKGKNFFDHSLYTLRHDDLLSVKYRNRPQHLRSCHEQGTQNIFWNQSSYPSRKHQIPRSSQRDIKGQALFGFLDTNNTLINTNSKNVPWKFQKSYQKLQQQDNHFKIMIKKRRKLSKKSKEAWLVKKPSPWPHCLKNATGVQERSAYRARKYQEDSFDTHFQIREEVFICLDGTFPKSRLSAALVSIPPLVGEKQQLYLIGGLSSEIGKSLHFSKYCFLKKQWQQVQYETANSPPLNLSHHSVIQYHRNIYIIGGISVLPIQEECRNQRMTSPFIFSYHIDTKKWFRISWSTSLRCHASVTFGRHMIIDGGITAQNKNNNLIYMLDLQKPQTPIALPYAGLGLSSHQIISTERIDEKTKDLIKIDGLLCYGGRKDSGQINAHMYYLPVQKNAQLVDRFNRFQWKQLPCKGTQPPPRYMHTLNLLNIKTNSTQKRIYCAVIGGISTNQNILCDMWLLNLINLQWSEVAFGQKKNSVLKRGIAGHCAEVNLNQIFVMGGYDCERQQCTKMWSVGYEKVCRKGKLVNRNKSHNMVGFYSVGKPNE